MEEGKFNFSRAFRPFPKINLRFREMYESSDKRSKIRYNKLSFKLSERSLRAFPTPKLPYPS